jgi:hypothetical protein
MSQSDEQRGEAGRFEGEAQHGWSPDVGAEGDAAAEAGEKARQTPSHETSGEERPIAQEEREGVSSTDMEPGTPFGAGDSTRRRGEDIAAEEGDEPEGHKGASQRPYGTSG